MNTHATTLKTAALTLVLAVLVACSGGYDGPTDPGVIPPPPPAPVLLKDILVDRLPSPFYHFTYDASGRVSGVSYASGLDDFSVTYDGSKIVELVNTGGIGNRDRIVYTYDDAGRVGVARYVDTNGITTTVNFYTYDGDRLTGVERNLRVPGGLIIDKTMALTYYPDGNLETITEHRNVVDGLQDSSTVVVRFEGYDTGTNVDGFGLIHDDFFDHFVLLPGVVLQKNNPRKETQTGNGLTYTVDWTYTYATDGRRPLAKRGDLLITGGGTVGDRIQIGSTFTYY